MTRPSLSVVLLTWNEERNIERALEALAVQTSQDFEVIIIDAASDDATVERVRQAQRDFAFPLHLEVAEQRIPIGEARNRGIDLADAPNIAFVSADARLDPQWVEEALRSLQRHDMVFGRQVHEPHEWTVGAAVRGLRYRFPDVRPLDPLPYASNVAAAYRKNVLESFPFDPWTNAAEDLLLARDAAEAGHSIDYNPRMVVRHYDVADARDELRKNVREGHAWGLYRRELGLLFEVLAWGGLILLAIALFALSPNLLTTFTLAGAIWLPALRRLLRPHPGMPVRQRLIGLTASPAFDLAFLLNYLRGLFRRRTVQRTPTTKDTRA